MVWSFYVAFAVAAAGVALVGFHPRAGSYPVWNIYTYMSTESSKYEPIRNLTVTRSKETAQKVSNMLGNTLCCCKLDEKINTILMTVL